MSKGTTRSELSALQAEIDEDMGNDSGEGGMLESVGRLSEGRQFRLNIEAEPQNFE